LLPVFAAGAGFLAAGFPATGFFAAFFGVLFFFASRAMPRTVQHVSTAVKRVAQRIEECPGFPGALRALGGLGGPSRPPI
jgi:hypothetical protein